ncbi:MAG: GTPase Era [Acidimicrobiia bacterium]
MTAFRSGFVTVVGRPNVGKSTLVNRLVGTKVTITSDRPQTTRSEVRGVRTNQSVSQIVFLDTPGLHKPRTALGERTNQRALATLAEVDVICHLIDAAAAIGPGDRFVADIVHRVETPSVLVVNKVDSVGKVAIGDHLATAAAELGDYDAFVPLSAKTGAGTDALVDELEARLPEGPAYYPEGVVTDQPETFLAAEILREKLIAVTRDELPHSITVACEVDDDEDARADLLRLRATVRVERESQKGIVIGRGGAVLKAAGSEARRELEALLGTRIHLETRVRVERDWQRRPASLDRLGY